MGGARQHFHPQPTDYESAFYRALTWGDKSTTDWLRLLPGQRRSLTKMGHSLSPWNCSSASPASRGRGTSGFLHPAVALTVSVMLAWLSYRFRATVKEQRSAAPRTGDRNLDSLLSRIHPSELNRGLRP